jgi:hypothetical protein
MIGAMSTEVPLKCSCGSVQGVARYVSPKTGNRLVCMCDDCQAYAHHLGRAEHILDRNGGTEVFQLTPSQLTLTQGREHLRCLRLKEKGLMRWYAGCCNTPLANTLASPRIPFVGVPQPFMDHEGDGRTREQVLGPLLARVQGRFGIGELPADAYQRAPLGLIVRSLRILSAAWIKGRHAPSPFFDASTGEPAVAPVVLSTEQREELRKHCGPVVSST